MLCLLQNAVHRLQGQSFSHGCNTVAKLCLALWAPAFKVAHDWPLKVQHNRMAQDGWPSAECDVPSAALSSPRSGLRLTSLTFRAASLADGLALGSAKRRLTLITGDSFVSELKSKLNTPKPMMSSPRFRNSSSMFTAAVCREAAPSQSASPSLSHSGCWRGSPHSELLLSAGQVDWSPGHQANACRTHEGPAAF